MKALKYFAIISASLSLAFAVSSCEKAVSASGNASVGFEAEEVSMGLGAEYISIPIVTTGETTVYPIKVTVSVEDYAGDYAATEDVDYMITSKELFIASSESIPSIEVKVINPEDKDELRFKLKIASYENAQSVSVGETLVKLAKSDYDRVCGTYTVNGYYGVESYSETWTLTNNNGDITINNLLASGTEVSASYNPETKILSIPLGEENYCAAYNFGDPIGNGYVAPCICTYNPSTQKMTGIGWSGGTLECQVSDDFQTITLGLGDYYLCLAIFYYPNGGKTGYYYKGPLLIDNNTITKVKK